ncbi:MAG: DUF4175 family protein, partial [Candidatus Kapaibacteriota bacterium]
MEQRLINYHKVIQKLKHLRKIKVMTDFATAIFNSLFFSLLFAFLISLIELIVEGDRAFRSFLFFSQFAFFFATLFMLIYPFLNVLLSPRTVLSPDKLAFEIGKHYPNLKDRLSNSIQLYQMLHSSVGISKSFIIKSIEDTTEQVQDYDFSVIIDKKKFKKSFTRFIVSLFLFLLICFVFPNSFGFAYYRILKFNRSFIPPPPFSLIIYPKYETVKKGENVKITVKSIGKSPQTIVSKIKEFQQENYENISLHLDSGNTYTYSFPSIKNSIKFYAEADWITEKVASDIGEIVVIDNPIIKTIQGTIIFPSYTQKPPIYFTEQNADLNVLYGSQINISVLANKKIREASIVLLKQAKTETKQLKFDTTFLNMNIVENKASSKFYANFNGYYFIQVKDYNNLEIINPIIYQISVYNDAYPEVQLLEPQGDVKISELGMLPMMIRISDDFGFSALTLKYRLSKSNYAKPWSDFKTISIPIPNEKNEDNIAYIWDLNQLQISPADEYEFFIEVFDNDRISGPKSSKTMILRVKLPSLEEVLADVEKSQENLTKELDKVLKNANEMKKEMETITRELNKNQNDSKLDWSETKKAENLLNKQKELSNKLSEIQKNLESIANKLQENNLLSPETLQKYLELQKLLQEVNSPELR